MTIVRLKSGETFSTLYFGADARWAAVIIIHDIERRTSLFYQHKQ